MSDRIEVELELKSVDGEQRVIEGYASITGNIDSAGDVIEPGAYRRTLAAHAATGFKSLPVFVGHQHTSLPVGMPLAVREDAIGLFTKTRIHNTTDGNNLLAVARERMAAGQPLGMSIGYNADPSSISWKSKGGKSVRSIGAVDLGEYSFTAMPANASAYVTAVKSRDAEWDTQYAAIRRFFDDDVRQTLAVAAAAETFR